MPEGSGNAGRPGTGKAGRGKAGRGKAGGGKAKAGKAKAGKAGAGGTGKADASQAGASKAGASKAGANRAGANRAGAGKKGAGEAGASRSGAGSAADAIADPDLARNLSRLSDLTARLVQVMAARKPPAADMQGPGPDLYAGAAAAWWKQALTAPEKLFEAQVGLWQDTLVNWTRAQAEAGAALVSAATRTEPPAPAPDGGRDGGTDRRFSNPLWLSHPWFALAKRQYLDQAKAISNAVDAMEELEPRERERLRFFSTQVIDMLAPTNFLPTNPDAIEKAVATRGASLVDGLENLVRDLEANDGELAVTLCDPHAFEVGRNIATAPGKVVFRNDLFELLQFQPNSDTVHETPLVIFPPWINKFYILDLKPQNSFIRYAVEQGFTVFVVSWVNPDASYAETGFDDYVEQGALAAIETVRSICRTPQVNAIGYCIGGTLLATTLALLAKRGEAPVASAAFFTTLVDFEEPGDLGHFIDDHFLKAIDEDARRRGFVDAFFMARTFSYMRANDLVYQPAVRSYLMGEAPPAFDLLAWNGDSTNLPAAMAREYMSRLYRDNELMHDRFSVGDTPVRLADADLPVFAVATRSDHIAPWPASFNGLSRLAGEKTFVLAESGHIAGIINPPLDGSGGGKYGHFTSDAPFESPEQWLEGATRHAHSWWPKWSAWLAERSGKRTQPRKPGTKAFPALEDAPGTYVKAPRPR